MDGPNYLYIGGPFSVVFVTSPLYLPYREYSEGESYIVLFHISHFDCFLFDRDNKNLSMTPETCLAYHAVVWDVSARYTVCEL